MVLLLQREAFSPLQHTSVPAAKHRPPCPFQVGRLFMPPYASLTPRHSTVSKAFAADCGWWLQPLFVPPCASMTPLGQLDVTALAAIAVVASDRYLPPYASWHGPLLFVPRRSRPHGWWPQPTCPHSLTSSGQDFPGHIITLSSETINPSHAVLEGTRRAFWSTVFGLRPLFAAACILRLRPNTGLPVHSFFREAFVLPCAS